MATRYLLGEQDRLKGLFEPYFSTLFIVRLHVETWLQRADAKNYLFWWSFQDHYLVITTVFGCMQSALRVCACLAVGIHGFSECLIEVWECMECNILFGMIFLLIFFLMRKAELARNTYLRKGMKIWFLIWISFICGIGDKVNGQNILGILIHITFFELDLICYK